MTFKYLCFSFKGRLNRVWFWLYIPFSVLAFLFAGPLAVLALESETFLVLLFPFSLVLLFVLAHSFLAVCVKRLHDSNKSGWNLLFGLSPLIVYYIFLWGNYNYNYRYDDASLNLLGMSSFALSGLYLLIACGCIKGTNGPNRYGPDLLEGKKTSWQLLLGKIRELRKAIRGEE